MQPNRAIVAVALAVALAASACGADESASEAGDPATEPQATDPGAATSDTEPSPPESTTDDGFLATDGDVVEVHYVGTLDDGSQFDSSRERGAPLSFTVGSGQVIAGFDDAVRGRAVGDIHTVRIEAADAYGEWSEDNVVEVPFNPDQGDIEVGDEVYLNTGVPATILEITDESVLLDANHPLAGEALTFEIEIVAITRG